MRVNFLMNGKKLTLYPYIRNETNRVGKTIGQSLHSSINRLIINSTIEYLILTERFK